MRALPTQRGDSTTTIPASLRRQLKVVRFQSRRAYRGHGPGERSGRSAGSGLEWRDLRAYAPGDDLRGLDWNVYARHDELYVKERVREEAVPVRLVLDHSASMESGSPSKWACSRELAIGLAHVALAGQSPLTIVPSSEATGPGPYRFSPHPGTPQKVARFLDQFVARGSHSPAAALDHLARTCRGPEFILLVTDGYDTTGIRKAFDHLRGRRHEISLLLIHTPQEIAPTRTGNRRLVDRETGNRLDVALGETELSLYREEFAAFIDLWRRDCNDRSIRFAHIESDRPVAKILLQDLKRAGILT